MVRKSAAKQKEMFFGFSFLAKVAQWRGCQICPTSIPIKWRHTTAKRSQRYFAQASLAGTSFLVEPEVIRGILRQQVSAILTSNTQANGGSTSTIGKAKAVLANISVVHAGLTHSSRQPNEPNLLHVNGDAGTKGSKNRIYSLRREPCTWTGSR